MDDYEYALKLAAASKVYLEKNNLKVHFYNPYWMKWIGWNDKIADLYFSLFKSSISKIYSNFGGRMIFDSEKKYHNQQFIKYKLEEIKNGLKKIDDIVHIECEGVVIGDLIYDTYLRFYNIHTIESIQDEKLDVIIEISLNIYYLFKNLLVNKNIKCLFTTYTSYIVHGIVVRLCLEKEIPVYAFGIYDDVLKKIIKEEPYHSFSFWELSSDKKVDELNLNLAKLKLESRFSGKIDEAVLYMRSTSFSNSKIDENLQKMFNEAKRNVVIYTHDFYDSPHVNRGLLFLDLYQFLKKTLENIVEDLETLYWIKIHPNSVGNSRELVEKLVQSFNSKNLKILDETVSNLHIVELKPDLIVTARGTVAMEMAYFEIPVVALYDNPFVNFDFAHTCYDLESYFAIISGEKNTSINFDKNLIYSYYYQAYMESLENVGIFFVGILRDYK